MSSPPLGDTRDTRAAYPVVSTNLGFVSHHVIDVRTDHVQMPDGTRAARDVVVHPGAVGIIALDDDGRVLLLQQYRHAVRRLLWEPPAGLLDEPGESPLDAARRELHEETGLQAAQWDVLLDAYTSPGMTDEAVRIYLARGISDSDQPAFRGEAEEADMPTRWLPLAEVVAAVQAGAIHNPLAIMGVLTLAQAAAHDFAGLRPADATWPEMSEFPGSATAHAEP